LGNLYDTTAGGDVTLRYREAAAGSVFSGLVEYVGGPLADFDGDGDVDGHDFLLIQRNNPSRIAAWEAEFGTGVQSLNASQPVPEPAASVLLGLGATIVLLRSRPGGTQTTRPNAAENRCF